MRKWIAGALGLLLGANALWMLVAPASWYAGVPGVAETGPANLHFIRDISCAYLVAAIALLWLARSPQKAWPATAAAGGFLALHALVHLLERSFGRKSAHGFLEELLAIDLPAILALWVAFALRTEGAKEQGKK